MLTDLLFMQVYWLTSKLLKTMKKLFLFALTLLVNACGGDDTNTAGTEYLNVSDEVMSGDSTYVTLRIKASKDCEWMATSDESWVLSIKPARGRGEQDVKVEVSLNPSSSNSRPGRIKVRNLSGSIVRDVTITQTPSGEKLTLYPDTLDFESSGGFKNVRVTSNTNWTISGDGLGDRIKLSKYEGSNSDEVVVTVESNKTRSAFNGVLLFRGNSVSQKLIIRQSAHNPQLTVSHDKLTFGAEGGTKSIRITSDVDWTISTSADWCSVTHPKGSGNSDVEVVVQPNNLFEQRLATVTISGDGVEHVINIIQDALNPILVVDTQNSPVEFSSSGGSLTLYVTANESWTAESNQSWCTIDKPSGSGNSSLTITIEKLEQPTERNAVVLVKTAHFSVPISIHQQGRKSPFNDDNTTPSIP